MFFILSKLFAVFLSPLVWILCTFIFALFTKKKRRRLNLLILTLFLFYFFSNNYISEEAIKKWEIYNGKILYNHYDAGIVLGGGLVDIDDSNNRIIYGQSSDRILQTVEAYNKEIIDKIIISGGSGSLLNDDYSEAVVMKQFLIGIGIQSCDILIDSLSRNTYENSVETKKIIDDNFPNGRFLLFTSAIHMRRAKSCFDKQNINFETFSTNSIIRNKKYSFDFLFIPSTLAFYQWDGLVHEITGFITYKLMGYA